MSSRVNGKKYNDRVVEHVRDGFLNFDGFPLGSGQRARLRRYNGYGVPAGPIASRGGGRRPPADESDETRARNHRGGGGWCARPWTTTATTSRLTVYGGGGGGGVRFSVRKNNIGKK